MSEEDKTERDVVRRSRAERAMVPEELRDARLDLGLTQAEMAVELGVNERTYRRWEIESGASVAVARVVTMLLEERGG